MKFPAELPQVQQGTGVGRCVSRSVVSISATPWTVAHQAPLSMGWSQQEYWTGLTFPPSGDLPDPGIKPTCPVSYIGRQILYHEPPGAQDTLAQDKHPLALCLQFSPVLLELEA